MRILHIAPYYYPAWSYGGIPRLMYYLTISEAMLGHKVEVVTTDAFSSSSRRRELNFEVSGVNVRCYRNLSNYLSYHYQFFFPIGLKKEKRKISDYDIVHIHGYRNLLNSKMADFAYDFKKPVVFEPNGTLVNIERRILLKKGYDLLIGRRELKRASGFIAVSFAEKKQFLEFGLNDKPIKVIPNGVEIDTDTKGVSFKEKFGIKGDYLLYLGKLTPRKGIEHMVRALGLLPTSFVGVIAGNDMGMERRLRNLVRELGLESRVIFTGLIDGALKVSAYKEACITVYAGKDEIFGLVAFESLLCGTPVIVADDCGCGEWVLKSGGGYVIKYGDFPRIAEIVKGLEPEREKRRVEEASRWIKENLNWNRVAKEVISFYEEILQRGGLND